MSCDTVCPPPLICQVFGFALTPPPHPPTHSLIPGYLHGYKYLSWDKSALSSLTMTLICLHFISNQFWSGLDMLTLSVTGPLLADMSTGRNGESTNYPQKKKKKKKIKWLKAVCSLCSSDQESRIMWLTKQFSLSFWSWVKKRRMWLTKQFSLSFWSWVKNRRMWLTKQFSV